MIEKVISSPTQRRVSKCVRSVFSGEFTSLISYIEARMCVCVYVPLLTAQLPAARINGAGRRAGSQVHDTMQDKKEEATRESISVRERGGETRETKSWT